MSDRAGESELAGGAATAQNRVAADGLAELVRVPRHVAEGVAGEHRQGLAEGAMNRGLAAPDRRVVEAGQVVVDQGGTVQELDRRRGGVGHNRLVLAAGEGDGER